MTSKSIIVTGGAGFIGSAACRLLLSKNAKVICVDKMTYAATKATIAAELQNPNFMLVERDICADCCISDLLVEHSVDAIMNFAAESHVDRSIASPLEFIQTNIVGTYNLLEQARAYYETLTGAAREKFRFLHVSTDEVFGDLEADAMPFNEQSLYQPSSPYSASKASSDHLVRAWQRTYGLPTLLTNCSNNYGPYQFPEKLIPVVIMKCLDDQNIPIYGKGDQVRDWLFVEDHVDAIATIEGIVAGATGAAARPGVFVATADVNCDGFADVIVGSAGNRQSQINIYDGRRGTMLQSFRAFGVGAKGGVRVAGGDVDGDG